MSLLYIWDPALVSKSPPTVEFVIGTGDSDAVDSGSDEFIAHLLADMHVTAPVERWSLTACRASYYSEYPDSNDWEDHWPIGWLTRVELKAIPMRIPIPPEGFVGTDAIDMSYHHENHYAKLERVHCLVVADFETMEELEKARAVLESAGRGVVAGISVGEAMGRFPQLRVDLGERDQEFFAAGAPDALNVASVCTASGGWLTHAESVRRAGQ